MTDKKRQRDLDILTKLLVYLQEDQANIDNVLAVIANAVEAKQIVLAWKEMSEEEAVNPECAAFVSKIITEVEDGTKSIGLVRSKTNWVTSCQLTFGVVSNFVTMIRNEILENYQDEKIEEYKILLKALQKAAEAGTDATIVIK